MSSSANLPGFKAGGTIRVGRFVKITADFTVEEAGVGDPIVGVSEIGASRRFDDPANAALVNEQVPLQNGDLYFVVAGAAIAVGALVGADADGAAVTTVNGPFIATQAASGAGAIIRIVRKFNVAAPA